MSNPYKDIASYSYKDSAKFKGREEEVKKFLAILRSEMCSVIYAESGIGKTSFVNAGIEPVMMEQGFFPIHIIIPDYVFKKKEDPIETWLVNYIKTYNKNEEKTKVSDKELSWVRIPIEIGSNNVDENAKTKETLNRFRGNLWWLLHTYRLQIGEETFKPYLVFDQFEEIFVKSTQNEHINFLDDFFSMMEQTTSNGVPDIIRKGLDELAEGGAFFRIKNEAEYKITFSLRKEYLSDFDYWTNEKYSISELYHNRMMLRPLTKKQAESVITKQPLEDCEVDGKVYDETLKGICNEIINIIDDKNQDVIEPVLLSIICSRLYDRASNLKKKQLDKSDLLLIDITSEISDFYNSLTKKLIKENIFQGKRDVERFEDLFVSDKDGHRIRKSMRDDKDLQSFSKSHHIKRNDPTDATGKIETIFDHLENVHLIRRSNVGDDTYIELVHDRFAEVIHKKQIGRKQITRNWMWAFSWFSALLCLFLFTIHYSTRNSIERGPFSEITNRKVYSNDTTLVGRNYYKKDLKTSFSYNNFVEELVLKSEFGNYELEGLSYLTTIRVEKDYEILSVTIKNCPQLREIFLENKIDNIDLNISGSPQARIIIGPDIEKIEISGEDSLMFSINNDHLKMFDDSIKAKIKGEEIKIKQRILFNTKSEDIVYAPNLPDTFVFPNPISDETNFCYKWKTLVNLSKDISLNKSKTDTLYCSEVKSWDVVNKNVEHIYLSDSVRRIGPQAFKDCKKLKSIRFSNNLEAIGYGAFCGLDSIDILEFPNSLKSIKSDAFSKCHNLKKIFFNSTDTLSLFRRSFSDCTNLEYVQLPKYIKVDEFERLNNPFHGCLNIKKIEPNHVTSNVEDAKGVIYNKHNDDPYFFYTDSCEYVRGSYYSKFGILFKNHKDYNLGSIVYLPRNADLKSLAKSSSNEMIECGDWLIHKESDSSLIVLNSNQPEELEIPLRDKVDLYFYYTPSKLEKIFVPFPQPDKKDGLCLKLDIDEEVKSHITLYVPYGCKKYYINHPSFKGFKSIEEETLWKRYTNNLCFFYNNTKQYLGKSFEKGDSQLMLFLEILFFCFIGFIMLIQTNDKRLIIRILIGVFSFLLIYTVIYWFIMLVCFDTTNVSKCNLYTIPISLIILLIIFARERFYEAFNMILDKIRISFGVYINWRTIVMLFSAFVTVFLIVKLYQETINLEKMLSYGKYDRATSLMYSQIMNRDSITSEDSALIRKVLLSSESLPILRNKSELSNVKVSRYSQDENNKILMIGEKNRVFLLDFDNHKQSEYKMPLSNYYYVNDQYICGYSNGGYSYICKRNATTADTLRGDYLHFVDNGKYVAATTDSTCYIYNLKEKPKLIKEFHIEKRTSFKTSQASGLLTLQQLDSNNIKVYNLYNLNDVLEKRIDEYVSLLTDSFIVTYNDKRNETYLYDNRLSLKCKIKGVYPICLDNKKINFVTIGNGKTYFHSVSSSKIKTDSVKCKLYNYDLRRFQKYWNWDIVNLLKKLSLCHMKLISINEKRIVLYNDSTKTTHLYKNGDNMIETLKIRGDAPDVVDHCNDLYTICNINRDSIFVYRNEKLLIKYPKSYSLRITEDHIIDKSDVRTILFVPLKNSSVQYSILDPEDHYGWGSFCIDGYIFNESKGCLFFENFLSISELIDKSKYLNDRQKNSLKRKIEINN